MNCDETRQAMERDYLAKGSGNYALAVDQHLLSCPACREHRANLPKMLQTFQLLKTVHPTEDLINKLALDLIVQNRQIKERKKKIRIFGSVAVAGILIAVLSFYFFSSSRQKDDHISETRQAAKKQSTRPFQNPVKKEHGLPQALESVKEQATTKLPDEEDHFASPFAKIDENLKKKMNPKGPNTAPKVAAEFAKKNNEEETVKDNLDGLINSLLGGPQKNIEKKGEKTAMDNSAILKNNDVKNIEEKKDSTGLMAGDKKSSQEKNEPEGLLAKAKKAIQDYLKSDSSGKHTPQNSPLEMTASLAETSTICQPMENPEQSVEERYRQEAAMLSVWPENHMKQLSADFIYLGLTGQNTDFLNGPVLPLNSLPYLMGQPPAMMFTGIHSTTGSKMDLSDLENDWDTENEMDWSETPLVTQSEGAMNRAPTSSSLPFLYYTEPTDLPALNIPPTWLLPDPDLPMPSGGESLFTPMAPFAKPRPYLEWNSCGE